MTVQVSQCTSSLVVEYMTSRIIQYISLPATFQVNMTSHWEGFGGSPVQGQGDHHHDRGLDRHGGRM